MKSDSTSVSKKGAPRRSRGKRSTRSVERTEKALKLIEGWLSDESGYDEATWPVVKQALQENRLSERKLFAD